MMDVSAIEVAQIYRLRWDIELFFKFIKRYFSFSHLIFRNKHIIQIMLYMTMIAASMIYIYRKINEIESFRIAKMIR
jgi:IS4 transposase